MNNLFEIEEKIKQNVDSISIKQSEIDTINMENYQLQKDRKIARFELVIEYVEVGHIIKLDNAISPLRYGDEIKIIRKNKKSVTVEILDNTYAFNKIGRIGLTKRVPASSFGETIYYSNEIQLMIERNEKLKNLLD